MRFLKPFTIIAALIILFASCKKDSDTIDTTPRFYFINGGTSGFDDNLVLFPASDTITYNIVISSTYLPSKQVTITLAVGDTARASYNTANSTNYQAMPSNAYSFQNTIAAGDRSSIYDTIAVKFNKQYLSGENYMLPIVISSISDYKLDTAERVIYLHTQGSQLAGIYTSSGTKTLYKGDTSNNIIDTVDSFTVSKTLVPVTQTTSQIDYADLGVNGWKYIMGFSADDGTFLVSPNDVIQASVQTGSFTVLEKSFNAATKSIYIKTSYKNLSGDERIVEETLTLQ